MRCRARRCPEGRRLALRYPQRQSALDQPRRREAPNNHLCATAAAIFGAATTSNCAGTMSRHSPVSPLIRCSRPQRGQVQSSVSITISTRGRCFGSDPRLRRRLALRLARSTGLAAISSLAQPARPLRARATSAFSRVLKKIGSK
jgi:hypothetical protein